MFTCQSVSILFFRSFVCLFFIGLGLIEMMDRYVPLPKSAQVDRVRSNAEIYEFELDEDDMTRLDSMDMGDEGAVTWNPVNAD